MNSDTSSSAALPIAHQLLRILIVANWLMAVAIIVLLVFMPTEKWIVHSLHLTPSTPEADRVVLGMRIIAVIGLLAVPLNHVVLRRLLAIVGTVRAGDPFVVENAARLQVIAWVLLVIQLFSLVIGGIVRAISTPEHPISMDAGFSIGGWLAVLLTFLLARVFAAGAHMRQDLEGTV
jgi:hypothetical protein